MYLLFQNVFKAFDKVKQAIKGKLLGPLFVYVNEPSGPSQLQERSLTSIPEGATKLRKELWLRLM